MDDDVELRDFFSRVRGIANTVRQANIVITRAVAPSLCPFTVLQPNEGDLSRVIAFLLDPAAAHGQGMAFLRLFLDLTGLPESNDVEDSVSVWTEDVLSTGDGRADIRVNYARPDGQSMHLLIENKPWAGDGGGQIRRYARYIEQDLRHGMGDSLHALDGARSGRTGHRA